jgi:hypothetical protein
MQQHFETAHNTRVVDNIPDTELPPAKLVKAKGMRAGIVASNRI